MTTYTMSKPAGMAGVGDQLAKVPWLGIVLAGLLGLWGSKKLGVWGN
jgi:hypothetical protein